VAVKAPIARARLFPFPVVALWLLLAGPWPAAGQPAPAAAPSTPGGGSEPTRRILLLYSEPRLTPAIVTVDGVLRTTLESRSPVPVVFYTEYLDLNLFDGNAPQPELRELLRRKYVTRPLDLIAAAGSRSLRIALHNRAVLFSGAPVVFVSVDPIAAADLQLDPDVTGTWLRMGWTETLDLARRLQPATRQAMVVTGSSPADRVWLEQARRQLAAPGGGIEVVYRAALPMEEVLRDVASLSKGTVVLVGPFLRDATGRDFTTPDAVKQIVAASRVPVYGLTDTSVGSGVVGGQVVSFEAHGRVAAELALRVLAGERPPPTDAGTTVITLDARQVERWGIDRRRLPATSSVRFQEPSLWEYRWYLAGGVAIVLLQTALIGGLLVQRAQRRRAQLGLAERLRFETLLSDLSAIFAVSTPAEADRRVETALRRLVEELDVDWATMRAFGETTSEISLTHAWWRASVPPRPTLIREDETPWVFARLRENQIVRLARLGELPAEAAEDRRSLEALGTGSTVMVPLVAAGAVVGCLSLGTSGRVRGWPDELIPRLQLLAEVFANALERQRSARAARESETQIRDLAGRLLTAQEEERRRIARDLHDGVNQELAAVAIALSSLEGRLPGDTASDLRREVARLQGRTVEAAEAIRSLSHTLHPGVLQHTGLVGALRGYCRQFEREHGLSVAFKTDGELGSIPPDVALCLYRVAQEGLGNAARHAGARQAWLTIRREGDDVALAIGDDGRGFDLAEARRQGLGLISLDERVRLVQGRLTIDTQRQAGTEIRVVVPLAESRDAPRDRAAR
jgi:signal transduction histidine kinase/ABC-type uncharacterized transport system substrate-binding protein